MIIFYEIVVLCIIFTLLVYIISREPIKTLYNYPLKIQERVKTLEEYKEKIPTKQNKIAAKLIAILIIILLISLMLRYVNKYNSFLEGFAYSYLIWTIVNLYDVIVIDIIWFCHDKRFVFKGTEDMAYEYHNYLFHIKGFIIGEGLALVVCAIVGLLIQFVI